MSFTKFWYVFHVYKEFQTFFDKLSLERERPAKWISPSLYKNHGRWGSSSCTNQNDVETVLKKTIKNKLFYNSSEASSSVERISQKVMKTSTKLSGGCNDQRNQPQKSKIFGNQWHLGELVFTEYFSSISPHSSCPLSIDTFRVKPGSGIGWTEPRKEYFIGLVDIRLSLKGKLGEDKYFSCKI